jgi:hypothetical protein
MLPKNSTGSEEPGLDNEAEAWSGHIETRRGIPQRVRRLAPASTASIRRSNRAIRPAPANPRLGQTSAVIGVVVDLRR